MTRGNPEVKFVMKIQWHSLSTPRMKVDGYELMVKHLHKETLRKKENIMISVPKVLICR